MSQDTPRETTIAALGDELLEMLRLQQNGRRLIIGIAGPPGAGKSKAAEALALELNRQGQEEIAAVVPMDGYHLPDERLAELKLLELKGVPDSFDAAEFVFLLRRLRRTTELPVLAPRYDRSSHASIANAITIMPSHRIIIVEGNYLLLDRGEWAYCRMWMDQVWYLDVDERLLVPRLLERHMLGGRTQPEAEAKVKNTDLPNAQLIAATKHRADRVIRITE